MKRSKVRIGTRIKTVRGNGWFYDGVPLGTGGRVVALTSDDGVRTYHVEFDTGDSQKQLYRDEFEIVNKRAASDTP